MNLSRLDRFFLMLAGSAALAVCGCAVSESLDPADAASTGAGGDTIGGPTGGAAGGGLVSGTGGTTGAAGVQGTGNGGATGAAGTFGTGGTTGTAGTTGLGGRGGATGAGGTIGLGGRGGAGSGGRGGGGGRGSGGTIGKGGNSGGGGSPDAGTAPDGSTAPTFTEIYNSILVVYCSGSNCHDPGSQQGVAFSTQSSAYTAVRNRVTPGNGAGSSFYTTVNTGAMPLGAAKLSAANLALIKAWIDAGALNN